MAVGTANAHAESPGTGRGFLFASAFVNTRLLLLGLDHRNAVICRMISSASRWLEALRSSIFVFISLRKLVMSLSTSPRSELNSPRRELLEK
jgi:hypothetical protein